MIAEVIVNQKNIDKLFDYLIPDELLPEIGVGSSVIVPFGKANKPKEAYIAAVKEKSRTKKLKQIEKISKCIRVFDEKQLELIKWMREKYLVTYYEAVRAVSPGGTAVMQEEWVVLSDGGKSENEIILRLRENGGACEINRLMGFFDGNIKNRLTELEKSGVIKTEYRSSRAVGDKVVRMAEKADLNKEAQEISQELEKAGAFVQARMMELLCECERLSLSDLVNFSQGSYSAVRALEKKGYIKTFDVTVMRETEEVEFAVPTVKILTEEQRDVLSKLSETVKKREFKPYLLHGVTGSGKTEVYMRIIDETISTGRQAIMLVPEISLTPQTVARFKQRFGKRIAVIHSGLSLGERYDQWKRIRNKEADIVIGARSAIFAPFEDIGAIIVDEEHEQTYKSEMAPRYDTHEVAEFRAAQYGALLLYASATPLVTSYYKAETGQYTLLEMTHRANKNAMPEVRCADLRLELAEGNRSVLSRALQKEISENLKRGEQTILFLNRRGFSTFVSCRACGYVAECPNCSISLKYHKFDNSLRCHYCGYAIPNYDACPKCKSKYIRYFGGGTQKVEEEVLKDFPEATVIRMDVDTTGKKNSHGEILRKFEDEKIDILIGTQMVTKGLDFPNVTLVGVISADTMLNIDDYRSGERTFSVLEQVTGRAGRAEKPGRSIIQTYSPENRAIRLMQEHNYKEFYREELAIRRAMVYPPFCEMISVIFSGNCENITEKCAKFFARSFVAQAGKTDGLQILGPIPAYVSKIKNKYIYRLLIKCKSSDALNEYLTISREKCRKNANYESVSVVIDKNPSSMG